METTQDFRSKLVDGLLAGGVLILLDLLLILLVRPVQLIFSRPGLLVYSVILLAVSVVCLEQALSNRRNDLERGWWGTIGGMVGWIFMEMSMWLGGQTLLNETSILSLMFYFLAISILWRRVGSIGLRYYTLLLLLSWVSQVVLEGLIYLERYQPMMGTVFSGVGYLAGVTIIGAAWMIFFRAETRLDRLKAAVALWCAVMIMIYVFRGGLI